MPTQVEGVRDFFGRHLLRLDLRTAETAMTHANGKHPNELAAQQSRRSAERLLNSYFDNLEHWIRR